MDLMLIRHAEAEDRAPCPADGDQGRRLTQHGHATARRVFARLSAVCPAPERIISSEAVRAIQTAELLAEAYGGIPRSTDPGLNHGFDTDDLRAVIAGLGKPRRLAIVGHEPDLSILISHLVANDQLRLTMHKCSCAMIRLAGGAWRGELCWLAPPDLLQ